MFLRATDSPCAWLPIVMGAAGVAAVGCTFSVDWIDLWRSCHRILRTLYHHMSINIFETFSSISMLMKMAFSTIFPNFALCVLLLWQVGPNGWSQTWVSAVGIFTASRLSPDTQVSS